MPAALTNDRNQVFRISEGSEGVRETLVLMRSIVRKAKSDPLVITTARSITRMVPQKNWRGEVEALFRFVRDRIRYVMDPNDVEALSTPERLLSIGAGDCDDKATLLAALLEAIGHPSRFVAVWFEPGSLTHVYVEAKIGQDWIPLETTEMIAMGRLPFDPASVKNRAVVHN